MFQNEAANVYSQHGEDGIIQSILSKLKANALSLDFWCCEFGAWDGKYLSNTFNLIENYNYKSVLIEPDPSKFAELTINMENFPDQHLFNQFVYLNTKSNLESFLLSAKAPKNLDLLSIDVDGMDYWIFESLKEFRPKIICIEYNHSIPFNVSYIQEKSFQIKQGSSAKAIMELGNQKGYTVVAISRSNLILLDSNLAKLES